MRPVQSYPGRYQSRRRLVRAILLVGKYRPSFHVRVASGLEPAGCARMDGSMVLKALGDSAVVVDVNDGVRAGAIQHVRAMAETIRGATPAGVLDVVPAFGTVGIFLDPRHPPDRGVLAAAVERLVSPAGASETSDPGRLVEIGVSYGGEEGPDLNGVATHTGLSAGEVIRLHGAAEYTVLAIGFVPGFPYLGGLDPRLHVPRRDSPRLSVRAGSVGIGGSQTGIYPLPTPGGWNLIGRTDLVLFDAERDPPSLLQSGDRVRFHQVTSLPNVRRKSPRAAAPAALSGRTLRILRPGALTTIQDTGRPRHRASGVPLGGAADSVSLRIANLLVGNDEGAAALECTLTGPEIEMRADGVVAVTGAGFDGWPTATPIPVRRGQRMTFGRCRAGARSYVAVSGGMAVPAVLGSRSTYLPGGFGGFLGRSLAAGDVLELGEPAGALDSPRWRVDPAVLTAVNSAEPVRVLRGADAGAFDWDQLAKEFVVTPQADRMGVRLRGELRSAAAAGNRVSGLVTPGTIQVPGDGAPIVLLADAQTIGGYPQIAHVIEADLPRAAQWRPGDRVRFREASLEEAHAATKAREKSIELLRAGAAAHYRK